MSTNAEIHHDVLALIKRDLPKYHIVAKSSSRLHRFIGWALRFPWFGARINSQYMHAYWTTIGNASAYPDEVDPMEDWETPVHEQIHSRQAKRFSIAFGLGYLLGTPVYGVVALILALLLLPLWILVVPWYWGLVLFGVGALLSSPVPFGAARAHFEFEGYTATIALQYWLNGSVSPSFRQWVADEFTGSSYCWMYPYKDRTIKRLKKVFATIVNGGIFHNPHYGAFYRALYLLLRRHGVTVATYAQPVQP